eukprot:scaffold11659_cov49-Attheya_sp.AAC.4
MGKVRRRQRTNPASRNSVQHKKDSNDTTGGEGTLPSPATQRTTNLIGSLVQLGLIWAVGAVLLKIANSYMPSLTLMNKPNSTTLDTPGVPIKQVAYDGMMKSPNTIVVDGISLPKELLSPMERYPNLYNITEEMRVLHFSPVVKFPNKWVEEEDENGTRKKRRKVPNYDILDLTTAVGESQLATEEERDVARKHGGRSRAEKKDKSFHVGRYDENRIQMYSSGLFHSHSSETVIDGYSSKKQRTVHVGIDLDGPAGTKVHAFCDGIIHSAGYNPDLGDYGHVIVVEHTLPQSNNSIIWALYGHLDAKSTANKPKGKRVKRGQVLGRFGDIHENGGWKMPHVHFQLSSHPPDTHDMPGAVSIEDRPRALLDYPDPRLVLGPLH